MTSLQGSLPDTASGLWRMDREYGVSATRVKHIVIHEAHIREAPDRHVVYRIDVFTTERNWCVYRRYSEFRKLHDKISETFKMFKGSFPPKQVSGNLSPEVIEQRRSALEHYLLKIVNCHNQEVAACSTVLRFLDLHYNDVYYVSSSLCQYVRTFGEAILNEAHYFVLSPTQLYCIHKRLRIPNSDADFEADSIFCDLGFLYDFLSRLNKVCIKPTNQQDNGIRSEITLLRNVKELHIQRFSVSLIKGLASIQLQILRLKASQAVTAMKDILIDSVLERKTQPRPPKPTEKSDGSWRASYTARAIHNSYTIHPWISLLYLDLSHNTIRQLDDSFSLLPNLQEIDLSYNQIEVLDLNYINPMLTRFTCTHCNVIKVIAKVHENLTDLHLDNNKLTELSGFNKLVVLKKLTLSHNELTTVDNIACLTELPRLQELTLHDNPLSKKSSYRYKILCMFTQACRREDILVDGKGFSDKEKRKAKNTRVKGTVPQIPSDLPFFGTSSDQVPTAFVSNQGKNMWNSILHDESLTSSSSNSHLSAEIVEVGESAVSPSDIRSTPSQTRTYDWDPAQAFASSDTSTSPPPITLSERGKEAGVSPGGSSQCLDNTSSCCGEDECEVAVTVDCVSSSLEDVSPLLNKEALFKQFNSSYYSLTGSSEIYSDTTPLKPGTTLSGSSPKTRVNPFGKPDMKITQDLAREVPEMEVLEKVSVESLQLSNSDSEYGTCGDEITVTVTDSETFETLTTESEMSLKDGDTDLIGTKNELTSLEESGAEPETALGKVVDIEIADKPLDHRELSSPAGSTSQSIPLYSAKSEFESAIPSPYFSAKPDLDTPTILSTEAHDFELGTESVVNTDLEVEPDAALNYETEFVVEPTAKAGPETMVDKPVCGTEHGIGNDPENNTTSMDQSVLTEVCDEFSKLVSDEDNRLDEDKAETFVVDKPDYDDVIFSGGYGDREPDHSELGDLGSDETKLEIESDLVESIDTKDKRESGLGEAGNLEPDDTNTVIESNPSSHETDAKLISVEPIQGNSTEQVMNSHNSSGSHDRSFEDLLEFVTQLDKPVPKSGSDISCDIVASDNIANLLDDMLINDDVPISSMQQPEIPQNIASESNINDKITPKSNEGLNNNLIPNSHEGSPDSMTSGSLGVDNQDENNSSCTMGPSPHLIKISSFSPPFNETSCSSGDEFVKEDKILSLSFSKETSIADLYDDASDDDNISENLTFSSTKLQL